MDRSPLSRILLGIFLILFSCFALVSLATYSPGGLARFADPVDPAGGSAGGAVGTALADMLRCTLGGIAAWVAISLLLVLGMRLLAGRGLENLPYAAFGGVLLVGCASLWDGLFHLAVEGYPAPGGLLALRLEQELLPLFQPAGTMLLSLFVGVCAWLLVSETSLRVAISAAADLGSAAKGLALRLLPLGRDDRLALAPSGAGALRVEDVVRPPAPARPPAPSRPERAPRPAPDPESSPPAEPGLGPKPPREDAARRDPPAPPHRLPALERTAPAPAEETELPAPRPRLARKASGDYRLPPVSLLDPPEPDPETESETEIRARASILEQTLRNFKLETEVVGYLRGPVITQYELRLNPGVKIQQIVSREADLSLSMGAKIRIEAPLPGRSTIGIEVPNRHRQIVRLAELIGSAEFRNCRGHIPLLLGKDSAGVPIVMDLTAMPHLLTAGATGSGKSVALNSIILSVLLTHNPDSVRMILIDPKAVELSFYTDIPHLACPVVTEMKKAAGILAWAVQKMDERYDLLSRVGVRNITAYNALGEAEVRRRLGLEGEDDVEGPETFLPYLVLVVDELADLMMVSSNEVEDYVTRLAQKSRAVGIHLVLATQRPSTDVITGLIKANLPTRIAFLVSSKVDSRVILDRNGAEQLLGQGDMLLMPPGTAKLVRAQGTFVSDAEVQKIVAHVRKEREPQFLNEIARWEKEQSGDPGSHDPLYDQAVRIVLETQRGSVSLLQRRLEIGYTRAARLMDIMAKEGIVGDYKGSQAREILVTLEEWEAKHPPAEPVASAEGEDDEA